MLLVDVVMYDVRGAQLRLMDSYETLLTSLAHVSKALLRLLPVPFLTVGPSSIPSTTYYSPRSQEYITYSAAAPPSLPSVVFEVQYPLRRALSGASPGMMSERSYGHPYLQALGGCEVSTLS